MLTLIALQADIWYMCLLISTQYACKCTSNEGLPQIWTIWQEKNRNVLSKAPQATIFVCNYCKVVPVEKGNVSRVHIGSQWVPIIPELDKGLGSHVATSRLSSSLQTTPAKRLAHRGSWKFEEGEEKTKNRGHQLKKKEYPAKREAEANLVHTLTGKGNNVWNTLTKDSDRTKKVKKPSWDKWTRVFGRLWAGRNLEIQS